MEKSALPLSGRANAGSIRLPLVDCDVHPMAEDLGQFLPYMAKSWRQHFETRGIRSRSRARDRYNHPEVTYRRDAVSERGGPAGCDPAHTIAQIVDPFGVSCALLLPQEPYGVTSWGDPAAASAFVNATNDYFRERWLPQDPRFALAVTVSPRDAVAAAQEIRRQAGRPGVIGIQLLLLDRMMGDRSFDPIYEAACECDLPVVVHQSGSEGCYYASQIVAGGAPRSYGERHVVLTQVGAANVVDLIVNGTFERFPALKVVFVEWGFSWLPSLMRRMDLLWERDPSEAPLVKKLPSQYVADHLAFSTQPLDEPDGSGGWQAVFGDPLLERLLLFSSDYPHYDADDPTFILKVKVPQRLLAAISYENAVRIFGQRVLVGAAAGQNGGSGK